LARATQHAAPRRATSTSFADRLSRHTQAFLRTEHNGARRALIDDIRADRKGWAQQGIAALAVTILGLGVAGSAAMTGAAQPQPARIAQPKTQVSIQPGVTRPSGFDREETASRAQMHMALNPALISSRVDQRTEALTKGNELIAEVAQSQAVDAREQSLEKAIEAAQKQARLIAAGRSSRANATGGGSAFSSTSNSTDVTGTGNSCLPVSRGYTIAARFGQVGAWSRYHTGIDFSAPVGTPIRAPGSGVVTNAGGGPASGWAGNYVAIRYSDGSQSLMAHMSAVSVSVGQTVAACQVVGAVGMTGRTFGPHLHFEIYPSGVTPGDVYRAVNPEPWLRGRGLAP
jgi:murein DD-endopeptidase MepM/ murein hydrolase activator NlpD